jgi:hypothetical protein
MTSAFGGRWVEVSKLDGDLGKRRAEYTTPLSNRMNEVWNKEVSPR